MNEKDRKLYSTQKMLRAKATIGEIENLIQFNYFNTAINRIYYACFYAVQAVLANKNFFPKSHRGILNEFSFHFVKQSKVPIELGKFYSRIFDERMLADYAEESEYDKDMIENYLTSAFEFIVYLENLLKVNN